VTSICGTEGKAFQRGLTIGIFWTGPWTGEVDCRVRTCEVDLFVGYLRIVSLPQDGAFLLQGTGVVPDYHVVFVGPCLCVVVRSLEQDFRPTFVSGLTVSDAILCLIGGWCVMVNNDNFAVSVVVDWALAGMATVGVFAVAEFDMVYICEFRSAVRHGSSFLWLSRL
jgi:hypothetical protein